MKPRINPPYLASATRPIENSSENSFNVNSYL